MRIKCTL